MLHKDPRSKLASTLPNMILTAMGAVLIVGCGKRAPEEKKTAVRPVKIVVVESADATEEQRYPAVIDAARVSELSFSVSGKIEELPVKEAQQVKQGDTIARLDPKDFKSNVDALTSQFNNSEVEYQRAVRLAKADAIAKGVLDQRKAQRDSLKAQLDAAKKALSDTVITAPFDGVVMSVAAKRFQNVQAGSLVAKLMSTAGLEAKINVPASVVASSPRRRNTAFKIILEARPDAPISATFKEATLEADAVSQTYQVTLAFERPKDTVVLPGMNATVVVASTREVSPGAAVPVVLPLASVLSDGTVRYVWVIDPKTMQVSKREVAVEDGIGEVLVIAEGLKAGEKVVGAGGSYLSEGLKVRPWGDKSPGAEANEYR